MGVLPEWWTGPYPEVSSTKTATDYLDALGANLSRKEEDKDWVLCTGTQELIRTGSSNELDSFVLGFALAHLICERHGLIGQRSGPVHVPHPADVEDAGQPAAEEETEGDAAESSAESSGESSAESSPESSGDSSGEGDQQEDDREEDQPSSD